MNKKIKVLFIQKDIKQRDIAKKLGVSDVIVCNVIKGVRESKRVKEAIAQALGMRVNELWPEGKKTINKNDR